jgi:hypothetical protein
MSCNSCSIELSTCFDMKESGSNFSSKSELNLLPSPNRQRLFGVY